MTSLNLFHNCRDLPSLVQGLGKVLDDPNKMVLFHYICQLLPEEAQTEFDRVAAAMLTGGVCVLGGGELVHQNNNNYHLIIPSPPSPSSLPSPLSFLSILLSYFPSPSPQHTHPQVLMWSNLLVHRNRWVTFFIVCKVAGYQQKVQLDQLMHVISCDPHLVNITGDVIFTSLPQCQYRLDMLLPTTSSQLEGAGLGWWAEQ